MKIAIAGGTGFVGVRLVERLQADGHQIILLTRNPAAAQKRFSQAEIVDFTVEAALQTSIDSCDAVVNLAGAPIAEQRWSEDRKQEILTSRKSATERIVAAIDRSPNKPQVLVNASAIGYYGISRTAQFDEDSPAGKDFLAEVCQTWESAAQQVTQSGTRLVILRLGLVLGNGGALGKMLTPFNTFMGGPIGSGKQWFTWIHRDDVVKMIVTAITDPNMTGVYNATAPNPVTMQEFASVLGKVLNRPSWLPVPSFAIEALLGEGAVVVLEGQKVMPKRAIDRGFEFEYSDLQLALTSIVG
jgi:uncharacterized protein